jgi:hypothetical protein
MSKSNKSKDSINRGGGTDNEWSDDEFEPIVLFHNRNGGSPSIEKKETKEEILERQKRAKKERKRKEKIVLELREKKERENLQKLEIAFQEEQRDLELQLQKIEREERTRLREDQDREYEEVLRISQLEAKKALLDAQEEENRKNKIEEQKTKIKIYSLPFLKYNPTLSPKEYLYTLRFKLPTGVSIDHVFDKGEPMSSVIQQLRFDLQSEKPLSLFIPDKNAMKGVIRRQILRKIKYEDKTRIINAGIRDRMSIRVEFEYEKENSDSEAEL